MAERWVTAEEMADAIKKAKITRRSKLGVFTRKQNHLKILIGTVLEKQYK